MRICQILFFVPKKIRDSTKISFTFTFENVTQFTLFKELIFFGFVRAKIVRISLILFSNNVIVSRADYFHVVQKYMTSVIICVNVAFLIFFVNLPTQQFEYNRMSLRKMIRASFS